MKFKAQIIPSGNATAVEVPESVMKTLGQEARPAITITINGHSWRSRVARMRGSILIGINAANRKASGVNEGDVITINVELDTAPREVELPPDLAAALAKSKKAAAAFAALAFGLKGKHVRHIEEAKAPATRQRRIEKLLADLSAANSPE